MTAGAPARRRSVVLLSGGLLSALALELAVRETDVRVALHFATGSRSGEDYRAADRLAKAHGLNLELASLPSVIAGDIPAREPGVYALMATLGAFYARRVGADLVWTGMAPDLHPGRPDMAIATLRRVHDLADAALGAPVDLVAARDTDRARAFEEAAALGVLDRLVTDTHDCDMAARGKRHPWGHGCGACDGCRARAEAFGAFERSRGVVDEA